MTLDHIEPSADGTPGEYRARILNLVHRLDQHEARILEECAAHRAILTGLIARHDEEQRGEAWKHGC